MANRFPPVPPGLKLAGVTYSVSFPAEFVPGPASVFTMAGVSVTPMAWFGAGTWGMKFQFDSPGSAGSFDQDAVESAMTSWLNFTAQAVSVITGYPAPLIAAGIAVSRAWSWTDGGQGNGSWSEPWPWGGAVTSSDTGAGGESAVALAVSPPMGIPLGRIAAAVVLCIVLLLALLIWRHHDHAPVPPGVWVQGTQSCVITATDADVQVLATAQADCGQVMTTVQQAFGWLHWQQTGGISTDGYADGAQDYASCSLASGAMHVTIYDSAGGAYGPALCDDARKAGWR